ADADAVQLRADLLSLVADLMADGTGLLEHLAAPLGRSDGRVERRPPVLDQLCGFVAGRREIADDLSHLLLQRGIARCGKLLQHAAGLQQSSRSVSLLN